MNCKNCEHRGDFRNDGMIGYECRYQEEVKCPLDIYKRGQLDAFKRAVEICNVEFAASLETPVAACIENIEKEIKKLEV